MPAARENGAKSGCSTRPAVLHEGLSVTIEPEADPELARLDRIRTYQARRGRKVSHHPRELRLLEKEHGARTNPRAAKGFKLCRPPP